jgi:hypothetical protein
MPTKNIIWVGLPEKCEDKSGRYYVTYEYSYPGGTSFSRQYCEDFHQADYFYNSQVEAGASS